ncbi:Uncharacterized protein HZ326_22369 [Fusarium oxysporum f. sp. albedinis]|nr:Uncharacterized protein HZ326_22369 [Fusarium oxysporum f. sp. albedinis]
MLQKERLTRNTAVQRPEFSRPTCHYNRFDAYTLLLSPVRQLVGGTFDCVSSSDEAPNLAKPCHMCDTHSKQRSLTRR